MELFDYDKFELVQVLPRTGMSFLVHKIGTRQTMTRRSMCRSPCARKGGLDPQGIASGAAANGASTNGKATNGPAPIDLEDAQRKAKRLTSRATIAPGSTAQPRRGVDLEAMAFTQGGHLNTNAKYALPEGSFKRTKKGTRRFNPSARQKDRG